MKRKNLSLLLCFFFQGIIIRYELFMQELNESFGNVTSPRTEHRIFLSTGWLDLQKPSDSANENVLTPPESTVVVSDLEPFTAYRFRVLSVNMAGSTTSEWSTGRTAEGGEIHTTTTKIARLASIPWPDMYYAENI